MPRCLVAAVVLAITASSAAAQDSVQLRGFADLGSTTFAARETFETIFDTRSGVVFGGGGEIMLPQGFFVGVRASRFKSTGERVFLFEDEVFRLGIPVTLTVTPVELTGGYRFNLTRLVTLLGGGGVGWHRYQETSDFATDEENVDERHTGLHLLGGAELRLSRWFGVGGELQWTSVADALGGDPNGVSAHFDETNLGGVTVRVKLVVGR